MDIEKLIEEAKAQLILTMATQKFPAGFFAQSAMELSLALYSKMMTREQFVEFLKNMQALVEDDAAYKDMLEDADNVHAVYMDVYVRSPHTEQEKPI